MAHLHPGLLAGPPEQAYVHIPIYRLDGEPGPSSFRRANMTLPKLTANELRFLGETADGNRDVPQFLVVDDENKLAVVKEEKVGNRQRLAEVVTASRGPGVPGTAKIRVFWNGHVYGGIEFEDADALFVTQSAIEKFLLPYYMRFKSGAQVQALENMLFNDRAVVAAYHIRPSVPKAFPEPPTIGCVKPKAGSDEFTVGVL